jgi:hypothetical protein
MFSYGETVQVLTAGTVVDRYGNETTDWSAPTVVDVAGVGVEPRPSSEPAQDARNAVTDGFTLYLPPGSVVTPQNRVSVRGGTYSVLGEPAVWRSPFTGWEPGVVVQVQRTEG